MAADDEFDIETGVLADMDEEWRIWDGSKCGGRPVWLDPVHLPSRASVICSCGLPKQLIQQVYLPSEDIGDAFHRVLYLFACIDHRCFTRDGPLLLRAQLPQENPYLPATATDDVPSVALPAPGSICPLTGLPASDDPAVAGFATETCREVAAREGVAAGAGEGGAAPRYRFGGRSRPTAVCLPEHEVLLDAEPGPEAESALSSSAALRATASAASAVSAAAGPVAAEFCAEDDVTEADIVGALGQRAAAAMDEHLDGFLRRVSRDPAQVMRRYSRADAEPLWCCGEGRWAPADVPPCEGCGAPRQLVAQAMPQLLHLLSVVERATALRRVPLDFGTVSMYVCSRSCAAPAGGADGAYVREHAAVQTMGADRVQDDESAALAADAIRARQGHAPEGGEGAGGAPDQSATGGGGGGDGVTES